MLHSNGWLIFNILIVRFVVLMNIFFGANAGAQPSANASPSANAIGQLQPQLQRSSSALTPSASPSPNSSAQAQR
ncbi:hypothetical protein T12_1802 [Trichinella patagoniensis]|uniref:Uncharacterized protein n=1 Tax=Trichinella patagoniensis TaxID=990121 RepID=A0A0V0ZRS7_9BILA|nr:hypothetical protein T12_1802 [Trichinella patagoniensis]